MGGEWHMISIMEEAEIICISGGDGINKIYPPKGFREKIIQLIHQGGKHLDIWLATCNLQNRWPIMQNDIKTCVKLQFKPTRQTVTDRYIFYRKKLIFCQGLFMYPKIVFFENGTILKFID